MAALRSPAALCFLLHLPLLALAEMNTVIQLPTGRWGVSSLDNSQKNSGEGNYLDGLGPTGYINYQPIAPHKGLHLASAASSIRALNATAALALENAAANDPKASQTAFTGVDTFTQTLGTYLTYKGGKVISAPSNLTVYLIFYGKWSKKQRGIISNFVASLDVASNHGFRKYPTVAGWWAINTKFYHDGKNNPITSTIKAGGILNDRGSMAPAGSKANPLTHQHLQAIVKRAVDPSRPNHFPLDPNGGYAVITDQDTYVSDFCQGVCAFHTSATFYGVKLPYAFVGNPATQCPLFCTYRYFDPMYVPPNGDLGADAIADKLGHELAELATNTLHGPGDKAGWCVGSSNVENADLCEWQYGQVNFENDMSVWNMRGVNNMKFLVQLNYDRVRSKCVLQYNSP